MHMTNKKTYFDLLDKLYDGRTTEAENQQLNSLTGRRYEEYFNAYSDRRWEESSPELGQERIDRMRNDILSRIATVDDLSDRRSRHLWPTLCKAAAVVALVVGTALASYRYAVTSQPEQQFEVVTAFGQKSSVTLPDGTRIWLNSGSRVSYSSAFNSRSRTVDLEGEAYFSVARNEKLPFVVQADGMAVTALGTKFNVKAYANEEEVVGDACRGKDTHRCRRLQRGAPSGEPSLLQPRVGSDVGSVRSITWSCRWRGSTTRSSLAARRWRSLPGRWNACITSRSSRVSPPM